MRRRPRPKKKNQLAQIAVEIITTALLKNIRGR